MNDLISVGGLHALLYCERLFYLEEVERIRVADAAVFAGRRLHVELEGTEGTPERVSLASTELGIQGALDVLRKRNGQLLVYEHKKGHSAGKAGAREAWPSDRVQLGAYAMLVEEGTGQAISESFLKYHADNVTVRLAVDEKLRADVLAAIKRARELSATSVRPPVTDNERLCARCSLSVVCLPEESRFAADPEFRPVRLLPAHPQGQTLHVTAHGTRVGRAGNALSIVDRDGAKEQYPAVGVGQVILHGYAQISTQALRLCADRGIGVHWMTDSGGLLGSLAPSAQTAQRHIRQFEHLVNPDARHQLAQRLVVAKLQLQLRFLLRATRGEERSDEFERGLAGIRRAIRSAARARETPELLGAEGAGAAEYFRVLPQLVSDQVDILLRPTHRSRRPGKDRFSAVINYGYGMLYRAVVQAIVSVGLHPGFGFYHRPRSSAHTLALDLMELFRVPIVDMAIIAALNRRTFNAAAHFSDGPGAGVRFTDAGRAALIATIERRFTDTWKHSVVGYSLSYSRMIELEARLLEKEWTDGSELFARFRLR